MLYNVELVVVYLGWVDLKCSAILLGQWAPLVAAYQLGNSPKLSQTMPVHDHQPNLAKGWKRK